MTELPQLRDASRDDLALAVKSIGPNSRYGGLLACALAKAMYEEPIRGSNWKFSWDKDAPAETQKQLRRMVRPAVETTVRCLVEDLRKAAETPHRGPVTNAQVLVDAAWRLEGQYSIGRNTRETAGQVLRFVAEVIAE